MTSLEARLLAAHSAGDKAAMVTLYQEAAANRTGQERAFFLTQAYIFALDTNHPDASGLRDALIALGSEPAP